MKLPNKVHMFEWKVIFGKNQFTHSDEMARVFNYFHFKSWNDIGKLAALWPFLGICAEVFILCAIILVYEKRRNKADLDESDTDQSPEQ